MRHWLANLKPCCYQKYALNYIVSFFYLRHPNDICIFNVRWKIITIPLIFGNFVVDGIGYLDSAYLRDLNKIREKFYSLIIR